LKGICYYTCNTHLPEIDEMCREQLLKANLPITCVSLNKELDFGDTRIVIEGERSPEMMHRQVLLSLQASDANYVFLCESDVLYHPSHFDFTPPRDDTFYYNQNVWKMRWDDKFTFKTDDMRQVSGICANRELLLDFYTKRNKQIEENGFNRHYEPGLKQTVGSQNVGEWRSEFPNICIRHDQNITKSKFSPDEFRNKDYAKGWQETTLEQLGWEL
jgi:hypothetical protein